MRDKKAILLRIDPLLWEALQRWADDELRSINGQIEWVLRDAVRKKRGIHEQDASADDITDTDGRELKK